MTNPLTTDFSGAEGTLSLWVKPISSDRYNVEPYPYNLFHVKAEYGSDGIYALDVYIPAADNAKPDALVISYGTSSNTGTITATDFFSTNLQNVAVTWGSTDNQVHYYLNGTNITTVSDICDWPTSVPNPFEVTLGPANHEMGHVVLWNVVLPASDILNIYDMGSAGDKVVLDLTIGASGTGATFHNPTTAKCYITKFQLKGKRIKRYQPVDSISADADSRRTYGLNVLDWDMAYESDPAFATLFADWLISRVSAPDTRIEVLKFIADPNSTVFKQALALEPGDLITLAEAQTGVNESFFVNGLACLARDKDTLEVSLYVKQTEGSAIAWRLGIPGYSELGQTTRLAL